MPINPLSLNAKLIFTTIALMIVWAVEGHAQVSSTKIVVVPVDSATTAQLTSLKLAADEATKAYNKAVDDAKRRILTTRDYVLGSCSAGRENDEGTGWFSITSGITTGRMLTFNGQSPECDTPQEKSERKREQAREDAEAKKWDLDHPMRYWLAGFCDGGTFTDDFKYLVPTVKTVTPTTPTMPFYLNDGGMRVIPNTGTFN